MNEIVNTANLQELKILLIISVSIIGILLVIVGFFVTRGITQIANSSKSMARDINEIKITVMHVDTKHNALEKRVDKIEEKL